MMCRTSRTGRSPGVRRRSGTSVHPQLSCAEEVARCAPLMLHRPNRQGSDVTSFASTATRSAADGMIRPDASDFVQKCRAEQTGERGCGLPLATQAVDASDC